MRNKMNKIIILTIITLSGYVHTANAALVSLGSYAFDDSATIKTLVSANNLNGSIGADAITDLEASTYIYGNNIATPGDAQLSFQDNINKTEIFNGAGSDLVFYFIRGDADATAASFNLTIGGMTSTYSATDSTPFDNQKYQVAIPGQTLPADLLSATVNLDDFDIAINDFITEYNISDINNDERLALSAGFYTAASPVVVPIPAAAWLFISGLLSLGFVSRRKR